MVSWLCSLPSTADLRSETRRAALDLVSQVSVCRHVDTSAPLRCVCSFSAVSGCFLRRWLMPIILRQPQAFCPTERWERKSIRGDSTRPSRFTLRSDCLILSWALFAVISLLRGRQTAFALEVKKKKKNPATPAVTAVSLNVSLSLWSDWILGRSQNDSLPLKRHCWRGKTQQTERSFISKRLNTSN